MEVHDNLRIDHKHRARQQEFDVSSSDSDTENSNLTSLSFTSENSSQFTSPRSNLLWDHGYDVAEKSSDYINNREQEWKKFNVTDDDKLNADKEAVQRERRLKAKETVTNVENIKEDKKHKTELSHLGQSFLPDLLAFTGSADMTENPIDHKPLRLENSVSPLPDTRDESPLPDNCETPPPLPATSPPPLCSSVANDETSVTQEDFENISKSLQFTSGDKIKSITDKGQNTIGKNIDGLFKSLLEFECQSFDITPTQNQSMKSNAGQINTRAHDTIVTNSDSDTTNSDEEGQKNDIEEEFEAILHAFDLNFGQDTYVDRFAGRRDKYGFILSPIIETPASPTPSSLSGYSGISSASPDPFSVFRMSPAPRGNILDLDLSSLNVYQGDLEENDHTVPIYQTVQAKKAIVIPEGYGWESGDDLLSPTGSVEWDMYENGLSSPPVSASGINLSQFGTHVVGWKQPQAVIFEEPEVNGDSDGTIDGESNSDYDSDSTVEDAPQNESIRANEAEPDDSITGHDENLNGESKELEFFANVTGTSLVKNQYDEMRANQRTPIADYLNKQSGLQRPESNQSFATSDSSSESSKGEDAEDEYSESETEDYRVTKLVVERNNNDIDIDQHVQVTELLSPRTAAILRSGGMFPEESDSSYLTDEEEEEEDLDNPERDSNMSSYGSGVLVTQYTSGDSEEDTTKNKLSQSEVMLERKSTEAGTLLEEPNINNKSKTPIKIHSPLDFSFIRTKNEIPCSTASPLSPTEDDKRSPRVFGRYYSEMEKNLIDKALTRIPKPCPKTEAFDDLHGHQHPLSQTLSSDEKAWDEIENSFTNIEFKRLEDSNRTRLRNIVSEKKSLGDSEDSLVEAKSNAYLESSGHSKMLEAEFENTNEKCTPIAESANNKSADIEHELNSSTHYCQPKTQLTPPVKIKVSHLARKGSFTNKVKRGFVQQLSEIFKQNDAKTHVTPEVQRSSFKKTKKKPDSDRASESPHMIFAKEDIIISERDSPYERTNGNETMITSANESLGFEVTALQRVNSFEENGLTLDLNEQYEDDFESDSGESDSMGQDNYLQLYEKQLKLADNLASETLQNATENSSSSSSSNTDNEDEISEQIEGNADSDGDDAELFCKIHACDPLYRVSKQKARTSGIEGNYENDDNSQAVEQSQEKDMEERVVLTNKRTQSQDPRRIIHKTEQNREATFYENKSFIIETDPWSQTSAESLSVQSQTGKTDNFKRVSDTFETHFKTNKEAHTGEITQTLRSLFTKDELSQDIDNSGIDLGGIFWNPKLLHFKATNCERKEKDHARNAGSTMQPGKENFSQIDDKKNLPNELIRSSHGNDSSNKDAKDVVKGRSAEPNKNEYRMLSSPILSEMRIGLAEANERIETGLIDRVDKKSADVHFTSSSGLEVSEEIGESDMKRKVVDKAVQREPLTITGDMNEHKSDNPEALGLLSYSCENKSEALQLNKNITYSEFGENRLTRRPKSLQNKAEHFLESNRTSSGDYHFRYPSSLSRRLYGPYCRLNKIGQYSEKRETTPVGLSDDEETVIGQETERRETTPTGLSPEATVMHGVAVCEKTSIDSGPRLTSKTSHSNTGNDTCSEVNRKSYPLSQEFKVFEYPEGDIRTTFFKNDESISLASENNGLNDLEIDSTDKSVENIDGRVLYPDVFEHSSYDVKVPLASPAQRESLKPRSSLITYCNATEPQRECRSENLLSKSNQSCDSCPEAVDNDAGNDKQNFDFSTPQRCNYTRVGKSLPVNSHSNVVSLDYAGEQNSVHADLNEGGSSPQTAVKNDFFHHSLGVCAPREITTTKDTHQHGTMRNDMQPNETKLNRTSAISPGINGFSSGQTDSICQAHMSEGGVFTYHSKDSDKNSLGADGGDTSSVVLVQTTDCQHVLEDEKGNLKLWPYSDFENSHKVPVTLHRAKRRVKFIVRKAGMSNAPSNMTVIQTAQHSTEMPENRMTEKYHSSAVVPEDRSVAQLMQTHGESVQNVLFNDTNGNTLTEEELSAILPKIADSVSKMKDVDAEEILPGITQSISKLQNGGNLVITTMTRKLDEVESDESGRGSPEPPHPILHVDDLDNSKIYLVRDSKGELFYVEDITSESQESAYFSSRNTSESVSDGGHSPTYQKISEIKQLGKGGIHDSTAEEIISAMYDQSGIQEITENEEEWSERTYEFDRPRGRTASPRREYNKDSFRSSYMVEEPDTLPRASTLCKDRFESSYEISGGMPWVYDSGMAQSYSQATQGMEEVDSASAVSGAAGAAVTRTHEVLTVEAETEIYPLVPVSTPPPPVPMLLPPVAVQADTPQYSLVKVDVTPKKEESVTTKLDVTEQSKTVEVDDKPIYKTVAHIQTREKQPPVKSEMAEPKKYRIVSSKATPRDEEEQETRMSLDEVDYKFSAENVEYKASPSVQQTQFYVRNTTNLETPKRYRTERKLEINNNNSSEQRFKTEIQVQEKKDDVLQEESSFYSYDEMRAKMEQTGSSMKVVRGSYLIKNNLEEVDGEFDDNLNMFDGDFTLRKDNPLYQSDEDLYRKYEREKIELARKQEHFKTNVNQDISFETVDRFTKSKAVKREEVPKQSLSELLLSRLSTVDSKDIRQSIDVKHHSEDIYGDPRFIHADGSAGAHSSYGSSNFDSVGEKVDLLIKDGKAFISVKVTAERIVPLDMEFNVWRKNQAIVTRTIEVDLLATEHRRRLYYRVMEETPGGSRSPHRAGPTEHILDSKQTLELFTKILGAADGEGDKEDITVRTRSGRTTRPFTSGMDLLY